MVCYITLLAQTWKLFEAHTVNYQTSYTVIWVARMHLQPYKNEANLCRCYIHSQKRNGSYCALNWSQNSDPGVHLNSINSGITATQILGAVCIETLKNKPYYGG
jgi:hypothetical protein